jgi:hypothetical protein
VTGRWDKAPGVVVAVGELSMLALLVPLEWRTADYIGLPLALRWTITGGVYALAVLAILTGRLIPAALGLVWVSGLIGALHSAAEKATTDHAAAIAHAHAAGLPMPPDGPAVDVVRAWTAAAVVTLAVAVMAGLWHLGRIDRAARVAAAAVAAREAQEREDAIAARRETERDAARRHELERRRLEMDAAEREATRRRIAAMDEATAHAERIRAEAEAEAARIAAEADAADRAHAREMEARRQAAEDAARAAEVATARRRAMAAGGDGRAATSPPRPATTPVPSPGRQVDDLQRRRAHRAWEEARAAGSPLATEHVARLLYGLPEGAATTRPQRQAAAKQIGRWEASASSATSDTGGTTDAGDGADPAAEAVAR